MIFLLACVLYGLLALVLYAGVCCRYANDDGYVPSNKRDRAFLWALFWPWLGTFGLAWRLCHKLISFLFVLCFKYKHGKAPYYVE